MLERIEADLHKEAIVGRERTHAPDLQVTCKCTLEEFFFGSTKTIFFTRQEVKGDGETETKMGDKKEIEIKPGMKAGHVFHFALEGNLTANQLRGDLFVTVEELPHAKFRREGDNLVYRHQISLADALTAAPIEFSTIDNELVKFAPDEVITPLSEKIFPLKGLPIHNDDPLAPLMMNHDRGNLILRFQISFPNHLEETKKQRLLAVLRQAC